MSTYRFDTTSLDRAFIGVDRMFNLFETRFSNQPHDNYPPYNVIRVDENHYAIELAVAGFDKDSINIESTADMLIIKGEQSKVDKDYIHRGLSSRNFERKFQLAEHTVVKGASIQNGILTVQIERVIPEEKKPRRIDITEIK